jgi:hypothetical protein
MSPAVMLFLLIVAKFTLPELFSSGNYASY